MNHPFTEGELVALLEIARITLSKNLYQLAEEMDVPAEELINLDSRLNEYMMES